MSKLQSTIIIRLLGNLIERLTMIFSCVGVNGIVCIKLGNPSKNININVAFTPFL